jgi:hypothetical protein
MFELQIQNFAASKILNLKNCWEPRSNLSMLKTSYDKCIKKETPSSLPHCYSHGAPPSPSLPHDCPYFQSMPSTLIFIDAICLYLLSARIPTAAAAVTSTAIMQQKAK